jgi:NTP pyrophosphatase (non-canonical NTP hydrolase)
MTIEQAQTTVDEWIKSIGVRYFNELTNTAILMEEVGELARIMARTYGEQSSKETDKHNLPDEMADVLFVSDLFSESNRCKSYGSLSKEYRKENETRWNTTY